jgi:ABC-type multidrug transport system fused ATPase/permease subunit
VGREGLTRLGAGTFPPPTGKLRTSTPASPVGTAARPAGRHPAVVFARVSFAFDDRPVLRDISFTIPATSPRWW